MVEHPKRLTKSSPMKLKQEIHCWDDNNCNMTFELYQMLYIPVKLYHKWLPSISHYQLDKTK